MVSRESALPKGSRLGKIKAHAGAWQNRDGERVDRRQVLAQYLRNHHVMTLATNGAGGPWAAAVFYANEGPDFYFLSAPHTRHSVDLAQDPRVAATIQDDCSSWLSIKGVQLSGSVTRLEGDDVNHARGQYDRKFAGILDAAQAPDRIASALQRIGWYRLRAEKLRFVDNSQGFGHKDEWNAAEMSA
jgi:uncharacterized protein